MAARWGSSVLAGALFVTMLALAGGASRAPLSITPAATNTTLCSGYSGCRSAGYSDAGYGAVNKQMYWRMYAGHNCTNYVAYRMIKAGMSTTRPWSGGGNASEWGLQMKSITDTVPNVGAVAWWARYDNGSGSAGHVAYVERVISSTEIIVSQDSWGGTFSWRRISKDSGRWPTGFIHFVDKTIALKSTPSITAAPVVGTPITVATPTFSVTPSSTSYSWLADGVATGVSGLAFTPRAEDLGKSIALRVRATRKGYTTLQKDIPAPGVTAKGVMVQTGQPTISGQLLVDETLSADGGAWAPTPRVTSWRWYADGVLLDKESYQDPRLTLTPSMVGKQLSVVVSTVQNGYKLTRSKPIPLGEVLAGAIEVSTPFALQGTPRVGETLTVGGGVVTPSDAQVDYVWLRNGIPIDGAVGASYQLTAADAGAHVSVRTDLTRANYLPWTAEYAAPGRVQSTPVIRYRLGLKGPRDHTGRAVVRVVAKGVTPVRGKVFVRMGQQTRTVRLVDGVAKVDLQLYGTGRRGVVIRYLGSAAVRVGAVRDAFVLR